MIVRLIHKNGQAYNLPTSQVVVFTDDGRPVACSYEEGQAIVHSDARDSDFSQVTRDLGIRQKTGPVDVMAG